MIPDPLHPAIVHFPIVLSVLGCVVALLAMFWRRGLLSVLAALLLILGAVSAGAAYITGDQDKELIGVLAVPAERLLDAHKSWAEAVLICSIVTAAVALVTALVGRWPRLSFWLRAVTAACALATLVAIVQTGHRGGSMVYQHGVGVSANHR